MPKLVINLKNPTPLYAGWYDPKLVDPLGLRTTEVKGLWRWWARAFVGGALYDKGYLKGRPGRGALLEPSKEEVELVAEIVGEKLGLGLAVGGKSRASMFSLHTEASSVRYERSGGIAPGSEFKLYVEWTEEPEYLETALKILLAAFQFTGVGRRSRRCQGSLDVISIEPREGAVKELVKKDPRILVEEAYAGVEKIVREVCETGRECERIAKKGPREVSEGQRLPPFPVVSRKSVGGVTVTRMVRLDVPSCDAVRDFLSSQCPGALGQYEWFLGLPRGRWSMRRASPIMLAYHTSDNAFGRGVFVSVFLSGDWPQQVAHSDSMIIAACGTFWKTFQSAWQRYGVNPIWP